MQDAPVVPTTSTTKDAPQENIFMFVPNLIGTLPAAHLRNAKLT
jgi:hypothetical protein